MMIELIIVLKIIFNNILKSIDACSRINKIEWCINIRIDVNKMKDFTPIFCAINSSFSSMILWGIVIFVIDGFNREIIKQALECIPSVSEKTSTDKPKINA